MALLPPLDCSFRRAMRRGLFAIAALFAFNAAVAAGDGHWLSAFLCGAFVLFIVALRTKTTPEQWPRTELWLRKTFFNRGEKP